MSSSTLIIKAGPNKDMLFDACKYAYDRDSGIGISFTLEPNPPIQIRDTVITTISHIDETGQSFSLAGYCRLEDGATTNFSARYNTRLRTGEFEFV